MHQFQLLETFQISPELYFSEPELIGAISDSVPVRPEGRHPSRDDSNQKNNRKPHSESLPEKLDDKPVDSNHQVDEYV